MGEKPQRRRRRPRMPTIEDKIRELKERRNAVILAHNYQRPEVQDIADVVGDSLELARKAAKSKADVIVLCGVYFMAETAAILCPDKTVLIPDANAGCPLANMLTPRELQEMKLRHPRAKVVTYVNSSAEIKAASDVCCTSSNAVDVVRSIPWEDEIIFVPDMSLGSYVEEKTRRELILWRGYCPTHHRILPEDIERRKSEYPGALVAVHPECTPAVREAADFVGSTSGILRYCREKKASTFIIGTEIGILHRLKKENPSKEFVAASLLADCPNMKLTTLEKILWSLEDMVHRVEVPEETSRKARRSIERMLEI